MTTIIISYPSWGASFGMTFRSLFTRGRDISNNDDRAVIKGCKPSQYLSQLSMLDFTLIPRVKLPVVYKIHTQSNKFAMCLEELQVIPNLMTVLGGVGPFTVKRRCILSAQHY